MSAIPVSLRRFVAERAQQRCEYCGLAQEGQEATYHIVPRTAGGQTSEENLALACVSCSLRKEARRSGLDPLTKHNVDLFQLQSL